MTRVKLYFNTVKRDRFIARLFILSLALGAGWGYFRLWIYNAAVLKVMDSLIGICVIVLWSVLGIFWLYRRRIPHTVYVPAKYRKAKRKSRSHWLFLGMSILAIFYGRDVFLAWITQDGFVEQIWQSPLSSEAITLFETILLVSSQLLLSIALWPQPAHFRKSAKRLPGRTIKALVCMGMSGICLLALSVLIIWASTSGLKTYSWRTLRFAKSMLWGAVVLSFLILESFINGKIRRQRSQRHRAAKRQEIAE
jgi:hypothetical protein